VPLDRDVIVQAATAVADADGIGAVTMRSVAAALGFKPMALYRYTTGKDDLLDGMVDEVLEQIARPEPGGEWRTELRRRAVSAREVLGRHPWALGLMESRVSPGLVALRHHDAVLGLLRSAGFSLGAAARAYTVVDAYVYGFVLQESSVPAAAGEREQMVAAFAPGTGLADELPHLAALARGHVGRPGYRFGAEFEPGLDAVLDAVAALGDRERAPERTGERDRRAGSTDDTWS
jgi:AcrR family transcriptional regulator